MVAKNAASYIRCSSDSQAERSPAQQRQAIEKLADKEGYTIVATFEDIGISGDDTDKRIGFHDLITAGVAGGFDTILCWDQDRLGRFDLIDAGRWISPLKEAGVKLHTVNGGITDWNNLVDQLGYLAQQMGKHQYLRDLARNVQRGHERSFADGKWTSGFAPYGFDVGDDRKLILNETEAPIVKRVFQRYAAGDSLGEVAAWLNGIGVLTRRGNAWQRQSIRHMLANIAYRGHLQRGKLPRAKYAESAKFQLKENTHPAIIPSQLWDLAQAARDKGTKYVGAKGKNQYALSGLLTCSNCGAGMAGQRSTDGHRRYICLTAQNRLDGDCERRTVREDQVLKCVLESLREQYFDAFEASRDEITARMRELLTEGTADASVRIKSITSKLTEIDTKLDAATDALIATSADLRPRIEDRVRSLQTEREAIAEMMPSAEPINDQMRDVDRRIENAIGWMSRLEELVDGDFDRVIVNKTLKQFIDRVEIETVREQIGKSGKRFVTKLLGGDVYFTPPLSATLQQPLETSSSVVRVRWSQRRLRVVGA